VGPSNIAAAGASGAEGGASGRAADFAVAGVAWIGVEGIAGPAGRTAAEIGVRASVESAEAARHVPPPAGVGIGSAPPPAGVGMCTGALSAETRTRGSPRSTCRKSLYISPTKKLAPSTCPELKSTFRIVRAIVSSCRTEHSRADQMSNGQARNRRMRLRIKKRVKISSQELTQSLLATNKAVKDKEGDVCMRACVRA
jgi:hypothetical protein